MQGGGLLASMKICWPGDPVWTCSIWCIGHYMANSSPPQTWDQRETSQHNNPLLCSHPGTGNLGTPCPMGHCTSSHMPKDMMGFMVTYPHLTSHQSHILVAQGLVTVYSPNCIHIENKSKPTLDIYRPRQTSFMSQVLHERVSEQNGDTKDGCRWGLCKVCRLLTNTFIWGTLCSETFTINMELALHGC